ncbi:MAG: MgtC/SapB family protein [Candidatus Promineifilaceae bacterium]|nr:MgtC/SapB family protein [Candidatus Promineifilaceae bacterium]
MPEQSQLFYRFGVALFIGILVGLQREYTYDADDQKSFAGVRTFALIGLVGCSAAFVTELLASPLVFIGVVLTMAVFVGTAYYVTAQRGEIGMTTEVATMVVFLAGALAYHNRLELAVALGVVTTVLLSLKLELHTFAEQISREDILATLKFAIITAIILPVLPNQNYGPPPFDILNPYEIWLMVVLISGISFLGYILFKILGTRRGIGLTGLLGGLASSTATTLSFAQRSQRSQQLAQSFALAILVAWTVMFARIIIEVSAVNSALLDELWLPLALVAAAALAYTAYLYFSPGGGDDEEDVSITNPFELRPAITFGLLYGIILLLAQAAQLYFGDAGVYISSIVSGLADVDAITLSLSELSRSGSLANSVAVRAIVLAAMSNTVVKGALVLSTGSHSLRRTLAPGFVLILAAGIGVFFLL